MRYEITELALTLGNWGSAPYSQEIARKIVTELTIYANRTELDLRIELYGESESDRTILGEVIDISKDKYNITPVVRVEPRSDRLKSLAKMGVNDIVFDVPASQELADYRFKPDGVSRSASWAAEMVQKSLLEGLSPEISLNDITRAKSDDVLNIIEAVQKEALPRGGTIRWRLNDSLGFGNPFGISTIPRSLAEWVRFLVNKGDIDPLNISVQSSDSCGLALANVLAGNQAEAGVVSSLFGLGLRSGWAATEQVLIHQSWGDYLDFKKLIELKDILDPDDVMRDSRRPLIGKKSFEMLGDSAPESVAKKSHLMLGHDFKKITGIRSEPVLTSLSGHAGTLHLMHFHNPEKHFPSDNKGSLQVSADFEKEFANGRQQPVPWSELEPKILKTGLLD